MYNNKTVLVEKFKEMWHIDDWINMGLFTENYINDINNHWLQFEPPSDSSFYALSILYTIIMIFGVFGNSLVIYLYLK